MPCIDYKKVKAAIIKIQAVVRAFNYRFKYLRKRRAAIKIQACTRGWVHAPCCVLCFKLFSLPLGVSLVSQSAVVVTGVLEVCHSHMVE